jgi:hypothetical protein
MMKKSRIQNPEVRIQNKREEKKRESVDVALSLIFWLLTPGS